jgi:uncharacterized protein (DUF2235 family)
MAKNIVVLSDGTGNSAAKIWRTNVWRLYQALDLTDSKGQVALYDDGVGSSSFKPFALLGGAVGWGLKRNVLGLYMFLCRSYKRGDRIYGFGFSRGAYTIRELVAFVTCVGLVQAKSEEELKKKAKAAYATYRTTYKQGAQALVNVARRVRGRAVAGAGGKPLRDQDVAKLVDKVLKPKIHFLGLWDTVAAYGLPIDEMKRGVDYLVPLSFPDRDLNHKVRRACHAVAVDDERLTFHPVLWNEEKEDRVFRAKRKSGSRGRITNVRQERLSQVWFAGMHSSVGGGYPDDSLAHVPLRWIMDQATNNGLKFKPDSVKELRAALNLRGRMYDSRSGLSAYYRYAPRKMLFLTQSTFAKEERVVIDVPKIHESVFERIKDGGRVYAPVVLPAEYAVVTQTGAIKHGKSNPYEHPTQAETRANKQEDAFNWVWGRRISYFLTLFASAFLAAFPIFYAPTEGGACAEAACYASPLAGVVGAFTPAALSTWTDAFRSHPSAFLVGVFFLALFLSLGTLMQRRITYQMQGLWAGLKRKPHRVKVAQKPGDFIYRFRNSIWYQRFFRALRLRILPIAFAIAIVLAIPVLLNRGLFSFFSAIGEVCKQQTPVEMLKPVNALVTVPVKFTAKSVCWPSGYKLQQGTTYRITIVKDPGLWTDHYLSESSLLGYGFRDILQSKRDNKYRDYFLSLYWALYRRSLPTNWMQPIARIGRTGSDQYRLDPTYVLADNQLWNRLTSDFEARTEGELFVFLNAPVIGWPGLFEAFYERNEGTATVSIEPR